MLPLINQGSKPPRFISITLYLNYEVYIAPNRKSSYPYGACNPYGWNMSKSFLF